MDAATEAAPTLPPRLLDLLSLLGYYAGHAPDLLIRLARVLAFTLDFHLRVMSRGSAERKNLARAEIQKVCPLDTAGHKCISEPRSCASDVSYGGWPQHCRYSLTSFGMTRLLMLWTSFAGISLPPVTARFYT